MSAHDLSLSMVPILTSCYYIMFSIWDLKLNDSVDMVHLVLKTVLKIGKFHRNLWISNFYWKIRVANVWPALAQTAVSQKPAIAMTQGEHAPLRLPFRSAPACVDHLVHCLDQKALEQECDKDVSGHISIYLITHIGSFLKTYRKNLLLYDIAPLSSMQSVLIHSQTFIEGLLGARQWRVSSEKLIGKLEVGTYGKSGSL